MIACLRLTAGVGEEEALLSGLQRRPRAGSEQQMARGGPAQRRLFLDDCIVGFYLSV